MSDTLRNGLRQYRDVSGNPCSLLWLVKNEPEWASNQIRHRDQLELELDHAKADAASWAQQAEDRLQDALRIAKERDKANEHVKQLNEALSLVAKMRADWLEMQDEGYSGAYYAFVKNLDDEWDVIMKAKESKP